MNKNTDIFDVNIKDYADLLKKVRQRIYLAQQRAILSANEEMLRMYWDIGNMLYSRQEEAGWGTKFLERLSNDLKNEFPDVKGFSVRNCQFMIQFYKEYNQELTFTKRAVSQLNTQKHILPITHISWAHNVVLMQRVKDIDARYWYMIKSMENGWSRDFLIEAIKLDYYGKQGALANNFNQILPELQAKQVREMLKDPYVFDMLTFSEEYSERDVELGLVHHIENSLLN